MPPPCGRLGPNELPVLILKSQLSLATSATHAHLPISRVYCIEHANPHGRGGSDRRQQPGAPPRSLARVAVAMSAVAEPHLRGGAEQERTYMRLDVRARAFGLGGHPGRRDRRGPSTGRADEQREAGGVGRQPTGGGGGRLGVPHHEVVDLSLPNGVSPSRPPCGR